jgi:uncharacterized protein YecT (DUF1311 family)
MSDRPLSTIRQLVALCMLVGAVDRLGHRWHTKRGSLAGASASFTEMTRGSCRRGLEVGIAQQFRHDAVMPHYGDQEDLRMEQAREAEGSADFVLAMAKVVVASALSIIPCQSAQSEDNVPPHSEFTSRGVISEEARETYRRETETCSHSAPGGSLHGPEFLACLKEQARREGEALDAIYSARVLYLGPSQDQILRLQNAQRAWLQFRDLNCEFIRSIAPTSRADEFFYDCLLKSTVDRRVELRRSLGD